MKRKIAIMLAALTIMLCMAGCSGRNDNNVSDTTNGRVEDSVGTPASQDKSSRNSSNQQQTDKQNSKNNNNDFMNNVENAVDDAGRAVGDAGRAIGDAMTGQESTPGTGMTGNR